MLKAAKHPAGTNNIQQHVGRSSHRIMNSRGQRWLALGVLNPPTLRASEGPEAS